MCTELNPMKLKSVLGAFMISGQQINPVYTTAHKLPSPPLDNI